MSSLLGKKSRIINYLTTTTTTLLLLFLSTCNQFQICQSQKAIPTHGNDGEDFSLRHEDDRIPTNGTSQAFADDNLKTFYDILGAPCDPVNYTKITKVFWEAFFEIKIKDEDMNRTKINESIHIFETNNLDVNSDDFESNSATSYCFTGGLMECNSNTNTCQCMTHPIKTVYQNKPYNGCFVKLEEKCHRTLERESKDVAAAEFYCQKNARCDDVNRTCVKSPKEKSAAAAAVVTTTTGAFGIARKTLVILLNLALVLSSMLAFFT